MTTATNLSPIETAEESTYNVIINAGISMLVSSTVMFIHGWVFHSVFSIFAIVVGVIGLIGIFAFSFLKKKRFGYKNRTLAERIVALEKAIYGETVNG